MLHMASVTQTSPLRVKLDGASTSSAATKVGTFDQQLNQRVVVTIEGTSIFVLGPLGGDAQAHTHDYSPSGHTHAYSPTSHTHGSVDRGGIYRDTTLAFAVNNATSIPFDKEGYSDQIPSPFSSSYADRATYPERLRLPAGARGGLWVATLQLPVQVTTGFPQIFYVEAFSWVGVTKGVCGVDVRVSNTNEVQVINLVTKPQTMYPGDFFVAKYNVGGSGQISGGYYVNGNLTCHRIGEA